MAFLPAAKAKSTIHLTCQPFQGNIIPQNRLNPASVNYLNAFPLPTLNDRLIGNYFYQQTQIGKYNTFDNASSIGIRRRATCSFFASRTTTHRPIKTRNLRGTGTLPCSMQAASKTIYTVVATIWDIRTLSLPTSSTKRVSHTAGTTTATWPPNYGESVGAELGINDTTLGSAINTGGPLTGGYGTELQYTGDFGPFEVPQNVYEVTDTLGLTLHSHQLSVGGTAIRRVLNYYRPIEGKGGLFYSPQLFTGYDESEYLVGGVNQYQIGAQTGFFSNISQEDAVFANDTWRATKRLTLNLGVRWDLLTWPYEAHNQQSSFNITNAQVLEAGVNGVSKSIVNQDYLNFAPRLGFAYDVFGNRQNVFPRRLRHLLLPGLRRHQQPAGSERSFQRQQLFPGTGWLLHHPERPDGGPAGALLVRRLHEPRSRNDAIATPGNGGDVRSDESSLQAWEAPRSTSTTSTAGCSSTTCSCSSRLRPGTSSAPRTSVRMAIGCQRSTTSRSTTLARRYGLIQPRTAALPTTTTTVVRITTACSCTSNIGIRTCCRLSLTRGRMRWTTPTARMVEPRSRCCSTTTRAANYGELEPGRAAHLQLILRLRPALRPRTAFCRTTQIGRFDLLIGGFQISTITQLSTGQPIDLIAAGSGQQTVTNRPDLIGPIRYPKTLLTFFDPSSFTSANLPSQTCDGRHGQPGLHTAWYARAQRGLRTGIPES